MEGRTAAVVGGLALAAGFAYWWFYLREEKGGGEELASPNVDQPGVFSLRPGYQPSTDDGGSSLVRSPAQLVQQTATGVFHLAPADDPTGDSSVFAPSLPGIDAESVDPRAPVPEIETFELTPPLLTRTHFER